MFSPELVRSFTRLSYSVFVQFFAWLGFFLVGFLCVPQLAHAQESLSYQTGTVTEIVSEQHLPEADAPLFIQEVQVRLEDGSVIPLAVGSEFQPLTA
ncbi:hypothetical protein KBC79_00160, partial [Candidatus Woesebacteria bacterium]|nr:hypothetical protein [Candidatus Woesebacteria bacterium]